MGLKRCWYTCFPPTHTVRSNDTRYMNSLVDISLSKCTNSSVSTEYLALIKKADSLGEMVVPTKRGRNYIRHSLAYVADNKLSRAIMSLF